MVLPEIIFPKKEFQIRGFESLYLAPSLIFWGTARGPFSEFFFIFSLSFNHGGRHVYSPPPILAPFSPPPPYPKKPSYGPAL